MSNSDLDQARRLEEIRAREAAATPGPWYAHNTDDELFMNVYSVTASAAPPNTEDGPTERDDAFHKSIVALTLYQCPRVACIDDDKWEQNAEFIAAARTDIPWLLALVDRLQGELVAERAQFVANALEAKNAAFDCGYQRGVMDGLKDGQRRIFP